MAVNLFPQPVPYAKRPVPPTGEDAKASVESLSRFLSRELGFVERTLATMNVTPGRTITSSLVATSSDGVVLVDASAGAVTVTLPSALRYAGKRFVVKKVDASANAVTILPDGTDTIDGAASESLGAQWESLEVYAQADGWSVLSQANILPPSGISGAGTATFIPIWTGPTTLASSVISQVAGAVTVGGALEVQGTFTRSGTGGFVVAPTTAGTINNVSIGVTTAAAGRFTTLEATGNVTLGDATSDTITANGRFASSLVPTTDNTYDLGISGGLNPTLRWRDLRLAGNATIAGTLTATQGVIGEYAGLGSNVLDVRGQSQQLRVSYDTNNYVRFGVNSSGTADWRVVAGGVAGAGFVEWFAAGVGLDAGSAAVAFQARTTGAVQYRAEYDGSNTWTLGVSSSGVVTYDAVGASASHRFVDVVNIDTASGLQVQGTKVVGAQGATISDPTGGTVQDSEARTAINTIIDRLQAHGLIA